jgi:hypothetical protein
MADGPDGFFVKRHSPSPRPASAPKPQPLDPNAKVTPENSAAIVAAFEQGLDWAMDYKQGGSDSSADRTMKDILRTKIKTIIGDGGEIPTNAELKQRLLTGLAAHLNPKAHLPWAADAVTSKEYRPIARAAFKVSFERALEVYNEVVEDKSSSLTKGGRVGF